MAGNEELFETLAAGGAGADWRGGAEASHGGAAPVEWRPVSLEELEPDGHRVRGGPAIQRRTCTLKKILQHAKLTGSPHCWIVEAHSHLAVAQ